MPEYLVTLKCGHTLTREADAPPVLKNPSCNDCPPHEKWGKVQRPVVSVELAEDYVTINPVDLTGVSTIEGLAAVLEAKADELGAKRKAKKVAAAEAAFEEESKNGKRLSEKVMEQVAQVEAQRQEAERMSRRECLAYLTGRGYSGVSRKPVGELREIVLAEMGVAV